MRVSPYKFNELFSLSKPIISIQWAGSLRNLHVTPQLRDELVKECQKLTNGKMVAQLESVASSSIFSKIEKIGKPIKFEPTERGTILRDSSYHPHVLYKIHLQKGSHGETSIIIPEP